MNVSWIAELVNQGEKCSPSSTSVHGGCLGGASCRRMRIERQPVVLTVHPQRRRHFGPAEGYWQTSTRWRNAAYQSKFLVQTAVDQLGGHRDPFKVDDLSMLSPSSASAV